MDAEVKIIVDEAYQRTIKLMEDNKEKVEFIFTPQFSLPAVCNIRNYFPFRLCWSLNSCSPRKQ